MGYTIGWSTRCSGNMLRKTDIENKIKKLFPKAKVGYNQIYKQYEVTTPSFSSFPGGLVMLEIQGLRETYFEIDLDVSGPYTLFTGIYILLSIGCSVKIDDKITKRDVNKRDLLKHSLQAFKVSGHVLDKKILKQALKIFYS